MSFDNKKVKDLFDEYSDNLAFWYLDALFSRATINSRYRKNAIKFLDLKPNSALLDVACGTGFNFKIIESFLKNEGKIVGLDISPKSLEFAKGRVIKHNWTNIKLISSNIGDYDPAIQFDAAICTFAISIIPDYVDMIDKIYDLLKLNGRFAIIGMKLSFKYPFKLLSPYMDNYYLKWGINVHRPLIKYIKTKSFKIEYYKDCHFGFEYILGLRKI